jgi:hypothetical protein
MAAAAPMMMGMRERLFNEVASRLYVPAKHCPVEYGWTR